MQWKGDGDRDLIKPAIAINLSVLDSAKQSKRVKKVVLTSSVGAAYDRHARADQHPAGFKWGEETWNPLTYEQAMELDERLIAEGGNDLRLKLEIYGASKKLAERAAWDWVAKEKPSFGFTTIHPAVVYGPNPLLNSKLEGTSQLIWMDVNKRPLSKPSFNRSGIVDVFDTAHIHIKALLHPITDGRRLFACQGQPTSFQMAKAALAARPHLQAPIEDTIDIDEELQKTWIPFDCQPTEDLLNFKFRSLEDAMGDFIDFVHSIKD